MRVNWVLTALLAALFIPFVIAIVGVTFFTLKNKVHTKAASSQDTFATSPGAKTSVSEHPLVEISRIISNGDAKVIVDITECVTDSRAYYLKHHDDYYERGIGEVEWADDEGTSFTVLDWGEENEVCWWGLVDALQRGKYAWEIDWKGETEDTLGILQCVADQSGFKVVMNDLAVQGDRAKTQPLEPVLHDIAKLLAEKDIALGMIDIGSDSYVLFLTRPPQKQKLAELAQSLKRRITFEFAKELTWNT
jgi:hypothetical protein